MKEKYFINKSFGSTFSSVGIFIFIIGIFGLYISFYNLIIIAIGAFIGFTSNKSIIDYKIKKIKLVTSYFGFIDVGDWIEINSDMKLEVFKSNKRTRLYSRSNRSIDITDDLIYISLVDKNQKLKIYASNNKDDLRKNLLLFSEKLELGVLK